MLFVAAPVDACMPITGFSVGVERDHDGWEFEADKTELLGNFGNEVFVSRLLRSRLDLTLRRSGGRCGTCQQATPSRMTSAVMGFSLGSDNMGSRRGCCGRQADGRPDQGEHHQNRD